jgi:pilus assembly protein Flp/PilA
VFSQALKWLRTFRGKDEGVTAIEYGLIAGLIAVAVVGALVSNGEELTNSFTSIHSALDAGNSYGNGTEGGSVEPGGNAPDPGGLPGSDVPPPGDTDIDGVNSGDPGGAEDSSG